MSFSTTDPISQYAGNGTTDEFTFSHKYYDEDDIVVVLTNIAGAHTVQTKTTHYTLAGIVVNPSETTVCTVTMVTPPATGEILTVYRKRDLLQLWAMGGQTGWRGIPLELQLDYTVMQNQYLQLQIDKAVKYNMAYAGTPLTAEQMAALGEGVLTGAFGFQVDGGGGAIADGIYVGKIQPMPYAGTITGVALYSDQDGDVTADILKTTHLLYEPGVHPVAGDTIIGGGGTIPALSSESKYEDNTLTDWTKAFLQGELFALRLTGTATIERLTVVVYILKSGS